MNPNEPTGQNNQLPNQPEQNIPPELPQLPQSPPENPGQVVLPPPPVTGNNKWSKLVAVLLVALLLVGIGLGVFWWMNRDSKKATSEPRVKIGLMMAFTGGSSAMGYGTSKGVALAKEQLKADNIEVIQADSKCDPKAAAETIKSLIEQDVVAIIGEGCSSASVAALPAANNARIPMISPSASSPTLSIAGDYFFRVVPPDNFQGKFMAQAIYDQGIRKVAIFYTNEPYGSGMNQVFREDFETLGGSVVATATAEPDVIDLDDQMKTLVDAKPEAIFIAPNSVVSGTAALRLGRDAGFKGSFFGADIFYDDTIIQNAPEAAEGLTVTTFPTGTSDFKKALEDKHKIREQLYAASQAYDAFDAIYRAVKQGAITGEAVKNALPGIKFEGVSGHIEFDANGEISYDGYRYDLLKVQSGAFVLQEP